MSDTAAETFRRICDATHTVPVCKPWVLLCRTSKTNGLTEAIVLGKVIRKVTWAERSDAGEVDEGGQLWTFITEAEWEDECFLSPSQVYRALEKLEALGFVAQRKVQRRRGGHPVRHVTVFGDVIGAAQEAQERGEWDPEPILRAVTSSRGREKVGREGATNFAENVARARDEVAEVSREGATNPSRGRDEPSRNKEELPPTTTAEQPTTAVVVAESDDAAFEVDGPFEVIARGYGYDPVGLPDAIAGKIRGSMRGTASASLHADLDRLAGLVWLFRGRGGSDPGKFGAAAAVLDRHEDARLLPYRDEASGVVEAALAHLPQLKGYCKGVTRAEAEYGIAKALAGGHTRGAIKTAMLSASQWTAGTLGTELGKLGATPRGARLSTVVPDDLAGLSDRQLVDLLRSEPAGGDVDRIRVEIEGRLLVAGPEQYQRVVEVRGLIDGREGWPRGMGEVNKLRTSLGVALDMWLAANRPSETPALTRGA